MNDTPSIAGRADSYGWRLLSALPEAVLGIEPDGSVAYGNAAACALLGFGATEELQGRSFLDLIPVEEASREALARAFDQCGQLELDRLDLMDRSGRYFAASCRVMPLDPCQGGRGVLCRLEAIDAGNAIRERQYAAVAALGQSALARADGASLIGEALDKITAVLGTPFAVFLERDAARGDMQVRAARGWSQSEVPPEVLDRGLDIVDGIDSRDSSDACHANGAGERFLGVPIHGPAGAIGVLGVRCGEACQVQTDGQRFLEGVANVLAGALARYDAERGLRAREAFLQSVLRAAPGVVTVTDRDGRYVMANEAEAQQFGVTLAELHGKSYRDLHEPVEAAYWLSLEEEVARTRQPLGVREHTSSASGSTWLFNQAPVIDPTSGEISHFVYISFDISDRVAAEKAAQETERLLSTVIDALPAVFTVRDRDSRCLIANRLFCETYGHDRNDVIGRELEELLQEPLASRVRARDRAVVETGEPSGFEEFPEADGKVWFSGKWPIVDPASKKVEQIVTLDLDISELHRAREKAVELERQIDIITARAPVMLVRALADSNGRGWVDFVRGTMAARIGFDRELAGYHEAGSWQHVHPDDHAKIMQAWSDGLSGNQVYDFVYRYITPAGDVVWLHSLGENHRREDGNIVSDEIIVDITAIKLAEEERDEQRLLLQQAIDSVPAAINMKDRSQRVLMVNRAMRDLLGDERSSIQDFRFRNALISQDQRDALRDWENAVIESGEVSPSRQIVIKGRDGLERTWLARKSPVKGRDGQVERVVTVGMDITDRIAAEAEARDRDLTLRAIADSLSGAVVRWEVDADGAVTQSFAAGHLVASGILLNGDAVTGIAGIWPGLPPHEAERLHNILAAAHQDRFETKVLVPGEEATACFNVIGHRHRGPSGPSLWDVLVLDITEVQRLEDQSRLFQKMDAIGNLTGGLAHDFNNVLAIVIGNLDLLGDHLGDSPEALECLRDAMAASERGADLTARLLAFARRQPASTEEIDCHDHIEELVKLMRRTLGPEIDLHVSLGAATSRVRCDADLFDASLMNIVVNARDAMNGRGRLSIESWEVHLEAGDHAPEQQPGHYLEIDITDDGCGMPPEVLKRVFEPLFTTKAAGKGTGFGLPMAYSFARQAGGRIAIYSEVGSGTTVRLYLPLVDGDHAGCAVCGPQSQGAERGEGRILLVDDDELVRQTLARQLRNRGYEVHDVGDAMEAFRLLQEDHSFGLLITDVVMPGEINGADLARMVRDAMPDLPILVISGYPSDPLRARQTNLDGFEVISKPFRNQEIFERIGRFLRSSPA